MLLAWWHHFIKNNILGPCINNAEKTTIILAANSSKTESSKNMLIKTTYLLMISAWRFSTKSTLISTIQADNNHTLTVRVTAFSPNMHCMYCMPKAKRASRAPTDALTSLHGKVKRRLLCLPPPSPHTPAPRPRPASELRWHCAGTADTAFCASRSSRHSTNCQRSFCASCTVLCISFKILCKKNLRFSERTFGKSF